MPIPSFPVSFVSVSVLTYITSFLITTVLHEIAHAFTALMLGGSPILHHIFVTHNLRKHGKLAITAAAGPLFSLFQGLLFLGMIRFLGTFSPALQLFVVWLCLHGLINFFGYLMTTPLVADADLGRVAGYLGVSVKIKWGLFILGFLVITYIGFKIPLTLLNLAPSPEFVDDPDGRIRLIFWIGIFPWLFGAIVISLLSIPIPHWISLVYPISNGFFLLPAWWQAGKMEGVVVISGGWQQVEIWPWVAMFLMMVAIFRLLVPGVRLGL